MFVVCVYFVVIGSVWRCGKCQCFLIGIWINCSGDWYWVDNFWCFVIYNGNGEVVRIYVICIVGSVIVDQVIVLIKYYIDRFDGINCYLVVIIYIVFENDIVQFIDCKIQVCLYDIWVRVVVVDGKLFGLAGRNIGF